MLKCNHAWVHYISDYITFGLLILRSDFGISWLLRLWLFSIIEGFLWCCTSVTEEEMIGINISIIC